MTDQQTPPADDTPPVDLPRRHRRAFLGVLGGAAAGAAAAAVGADLAAADSTDVADFVARHNEVLHAALDSNTLHVADIDAVEQLLRINAAATGTPPTTTAPSTTTTTTIPATTTTTTAPTTTTTTTAPPPYDRLIANGEHFPNGFTVPAGETWQFANGAQVTSAGNVIVEGTLKIHQLDPAQQARLTFVDVNPQGMTGGDTHAPVAGEVGLWVVNNGRLDCQGAPKTAWTRLVGAANAGATTLEVLDATGWRVGDEIVVTPTAPRSEANNHAKFDRRGITAINGTTVTLSAPLSHNHPVVDGRFTAEVLNLTRSVAIAGTNGGQAHIMSVHQGMHATEQVPWAFSYVELAHLAPSKRDGVNREFGVPGRYALHLHHGAGRLDGTVFEGVAAHDCRNHVFVAHSTNGITFRNCVSHGSIDSVYWWDPGDSSERVVYDRCVAHNAWAPEVGEGKFKTVGFFAADTPTDEGSKMLGCVAAAIEGIDAAGFFWDNASAGAWEFRDCVGHHITGQGVRVWQNSSDINKLHDSVMYRCGGGTFHGAYSNRYAYINVEFHDCGVGIDLNAVSRLGDALTRQLWHGVKVTACTTPMVLRDAPVNSESVTDFRGCEIPSVRVEATHADQRHHWDFTDCGLAPADFTIVSRPGDFRIRTQDGGQAWQLTGSGDWQSIPAF